MKVNCLSCGHNIELDDAYDDNYEGEVKCFGCGAVLELRTEQHHIRHVRLAHRDAHGERPGEHRGEHRGE